MKGTLAPLKTLGQALGPPPPFGGRSKGVRRVA